jgi:hypothetical protein
MTTAKKKLPPLTAAEKKKLGKGNPAAVRVMSASVAAKLTPADKKLLAKITPEHQAQAAVTLTYVPLEFDNPHYVAPTADTNETAVFVNRHRNTCIRVMIGRKKVTFIPMDAEGIMVKRIGIDAFNEEWRLTLADYCPSGAAQQYLHSYAALRHISEEARTLLEEISKSGALSNTTKENTMTTTTTAATKPAATAATKPAAYDKNKAAAGYAAATAKAPAKAPAKAAAPKPSSKAPAKAVKPAQKSASKAATPAKPAAKAAKPKATAKPAAKAAAAVKPRSDYSGKKITALTKDTGAREGSLRHKLRLAVLKSTTADQALGKVVEFDGEEHPITGTILTNMVALKMIKLS